MNNILKIVYLVISFVPHIYWSLLEIATSGKGAIYEKEGQSIFSTTLLFLFSSVFIILFIIKKNKTFKTCSVLFLILVLLFYLYEIVDLFLTAYLNDAIPFILWNSFLFLFSLWILIITMREKATDNILA
ncbi:MAG TPA: hypothetical protein VG738_11850 [Chitinophagaceae bacterium]|nr:hypothetical protein [Chitinophagaceae bacterium]